MHPQHNLRMTSYSLCASERALVQSVYDKVARLEELAEEAIAILDDIREDDNQIRDNMEKKNPMTLKNMLSQIESGFETASDEIPLLHMRLVNEFSADPAASPASQGETAVNKERVTQPGEKPEKVTEMMTAFKQLEIEKKNEMLKRLIDCQREPAMGPDPVEIVMMGFKTLSEGGKREMLKRLIDL